MGKLYPWT